MPNKIRWGILGCGRIARKFAADLKYVDDATLIAVGSRSQAVADEFAASFPVTYRHNSYEGLASNPEVDIIYVASPHGLHRDHVLLCVENGKAVLCEKAFALNAGQAREMINAAQKNRVFLMEALWTKFLPHYQLMKQMIAEGKLGEIRNVLVNFGFIPASPIPDRLFDPALGGGTMLDIGIYNVFMAMSVLGKPDTIEASMEPASTGVDAQCAVLFKYKSGAMAQLFSSFTTNLPTEADISGDRGRIRLASRFYEPGTTIEFYPERVDSKQIIPFDREAGFGYQFEARHAGECLRKGLVQSEVMSHRDTLELMETLDNIRSVAGIRYEVDE
ncbi:MAG TPA: Gfo/Idh/MocA family oxidoreductase [Puia sp.]|nr:Gfo/Idh/MocA family oxidoreductase [Puia sp.]